MESFSRESIADWRRCEFPLLVEVTCFQPLSNAGQLQVIPCSTNHAVILTRLWHSRLPKVQAGPWKYAFKAHQAGITYAVALWHNPSARGLPSNWVELRRMAASPDAPYNTCSYFLAAMTRWFTVNHPEHERCISYQDVNVHLGTIYKAANWIPTHFSRPRKRDRSKLRNGTTRHYRSDLNSLDTASAGKLRWEWGLNKAERRIIRKQAIAYSIDELKCVQPTL